MSFHDLALAALYRLACALERLRPNDRTEHR